MVCPWPLKDLKRLDIENNKGDFMAMDEKAIQDIFKHLENKDLLAATQDFDKELIAALSNHAKRTSNLNVPYNSSSIAAATTLADLLLQFVTEELTEDFKRPILISIIQKYNEAFKNMIKQKETPPAEA
jgi:hypothetical protein